MSAADVETEILTPMQGMFLPPRKLEDQQLAQSLRSYVEVLQGFDSVDLHNAWVSTISEHTKRDWPLPFAFLKAAKQSASERRIARTYDSAEQETKKQNQPWEQWQKVRSTPLAKAAARMDVAWALKCKILDGNHPDTVDLQALKRGKDQALVTAARIQAREEIMFNDHTLRFSAENREIALQGFRTLALREAETQQEIARG